MTNAQKWVSVFLFLFVILLVLSKLTNREKESYSDIDESAYSNEEIQSEKAGEPLSEAQLLIKENGCKTCHGSNLAGSGSGPSLMKLNEKWNKEELISFLKNPTSFSNDPRLRASNGKYRMSMPPVDKLNDEELGVLAEHLLKLN